MSDDDKGHALACIGVYLAYTTGHETCDMVDTTVHHLIGAGHEASDAEEWTEEEVKELYTWYEGYSTLCGERPVYEEAQTEEEMQEGEAVEEEAGEEVVVEEEAVEEEAGEEVAGEEEAVEEETGEEVAVEEEVTEEDTSA